MYYLFRFASRVLPWIPRRLAYACGSMLGLLIWLLAKKARMQATKNILHVLGTHVQETRVGRKKLRRVVQGMFISNVYNYLELFTLQSRSPEELLRTMELRDEEHLQAALAQGKGAIIFVPHMGPFDYTIQYMGIKGYDVTVPVEHLKDQRLLELTLELRKSHGIHYLPVAGSTSMRTIIQNLRENKVVLIAADRAIEGKSVEVNFFGAPARLPIGPVRLAQRTGAPLVGAICYRTPQLVAVGQWVPLSLEMTGEQRADIDCMMQSFIGKMEDIIRGHPEQWIAFAPIWLEDSENAS